MLGEEEAAEALSVLERLLVAVESGSLQCSAGQRERLRGAAEALRQLLATPPSTN